MHSSSSLIRETKDSIKPEEIITGGGIILITRTVGHVPGKERVLHHKRDFEPTRLIDTKKMRLLCGIVSSIEFSKLMGKKWPTSR